MQTDKRKIWASKTKCINKYKIDVIKKKNAYNYFELDKGLYRENGSKVPITCDSDHWDISLRDYYNRSCP